MDVTEEMAVVSGDLTEEPVLSADKTEEETEESNCFPLEASNPDALMLSETGMKGETAEIVASPIVRGEKADALNPKLH